MSNSLAPRVVAGVNLDQVIDALLRADPDILEIVLFGSAVYAPELARDVDIIVTTRKKKVRFESLSTLERLGKVDLIVRERGEPIHPEIALGVCAVGVPLFGEDETYKEARQFMGEPSFDEARRRVKIADGLFEQAQKL